MTFSLVIVEGKLDICMKGPLFYKYIEETEPIRTTGILYKYTIEIYGIAVAVYIVSERGKTFHQYSLA